jgi:hypothetical protein
MFVPTFTTSPSLLVFGDKAFDATIPYNNKCVSWNVAQIAILLNVMPTHTIACFFVLGWLAIHQFVVVAMAATISPCVFVVIRVRVFHILLQSLLKSLPQTDAHYLYKIKSPYVFSHFLVAWLADGGDLGYFRSFLRF